jgi:hypothetical protein
MIIIAMDDTLPQNLQQEITKRKSKKWARFEKEKPSLAWTQGNSKPKPNLNDFPPVGGAGTLDDEGGGGGGGATLGVGGGGGGGPPVASLMKCYNIERGGSLTGWRTSRQTVLLLWRTFFLFCDSLDADKHVL